MYCKSVHCETSCSLRTDGRTDGPTLRNWQSLFTVLPKCLIIFFFHFGRKVIRPAIKTGWSPFSVSTCLSHHNSVTMLHSTHLYPSNMTICFTKREAIDTYGLIYKRVLFEFIIQFTVTTSREYVRQRNKATVICQWFICLCTRPHTLIMHNFACQTSCTNFNVRQNVVIHTNKSRSHVLALSRLALHFCYHHDSAIHLHQLSLQTSINLSFSTDDLSLIPQNTNCVTTQNTSCVKHKI
jgi:hypothetical protein